MDEEQPRPTLRSLMTMGTSTGLVLDLGHLGP